MNPRVDFYFSKEGKCQEAIRQLRVIALDCALTEELKWGVPCYMYGKANVVLIHVFKEYCAMLFFKGALLSNDDGILVQQTKNVQAARQIRFTSLREVIELELRIRACIYEAIEVEKAGLQVKLIEKEALVLTDELQRRIEAMPALKAAFEKLTPGRQRAYNLYFSAPKQSKTREARIEKSIAQILAGKGLND
jgi:uncharacterized protein YdeI (YjbR/CyaY-like superfamily)